MPDETLAFTQLEHPAPHRHRVGLLALCFGVLGAPLAWNLELLTGAALSGHACYPRYTLLAAPLWGGAGIFLIAMSGAAICLGIVAGLVSWRSWVITRGESRQAAYSGNGRTRFMALCGLLTSGLFVVVLLFTMAVVFMVPLCTR